MVDLRKNSNKNKISNNTQEEPPLAEKRGGSSFVGIRQHDIEFGIRFGANLRLLRLKAGLTQEELARRVPMNRAYLAEVEGGKKRISLILAYRIAKALDISLTELVL